MTDIHECNGRDTPAMRNGIAYLRIINVIVLCAGVVLLVVCFSANREKAAADRNLIDVASIAVLERQLAGLSAELARIDGQIQSMELSAASDEPPPVRVPIGESECDGLRAALAEVSASLDALERTVMESALQDIPVDPEREAIIQAIMTSNYASLNAKYKAQFLDPMTAEQLRADSLGMLRLLPASLGSRDSEVLYAAVELLRASGSSTVRADICRHMKGANNQLVVPGLLSALLHDSSPQVRTEAAETLRDYRDRPDVVAALRQAQEQDESHLVREEVRRSLKGL
jgi:hypothetical protein